MTEAPLSAQQAAYQTVNALVGGVLMPIDDQQRISARLDDAQFRAEYWPAVDFYLALAQVTSGQDPMALLREHMRLVMTES